MFHHKLFKMAAQDKTFNVQSNAQVADHSDTTGISAGSVDSSNIDIRCNDSYKENIPGNVSKTSSGVVEGHRMHQLRKGLERTVDKCVSSGRYSLFMSHLPALGEKNPRALKAIQSQYLQKLRENIQCEIETMFKEENMATLMGELDQLIEDTPETEVGAWRPSADVKENLRPHVMSVKEKQRKRLQDTLVSMESETKQLQDVLSRKRQKLENTIRQCKNIVDKLITEG